MKLNAKLNSAEVKKTASYFKASLISILIGIGLTMILISFLGTNPIEFFIKTFNVVLTRPTNLQNSLAWFATYALFGVGLAIGFKIGLFNMSGSGQAIISMGMTGVMLISLFGDQTAINNASSSLIILILIIMVSMSVMLSSIIGILKVFFNIHEVATSILLNWTVWYIFKWAFMTNGWNSSTPAIPISWIEIGGLKWLLPIILMTIVFVSIWFVLTYTTVGYKFKLVGTQKDASKYVGVNYKRYIISATAVQGLCIGLGSFVYWCAIKRSYSLTTDVIPTIGFDAIAISLLAFNNLLGILPISLLWGILNVGMTAAIPTFPDLGREISPLVFGFVVYSSTFVSLFIRFKPIKIFKFNLYYYHFDIKTRNLVKEKKSEIKQFKFEIKNLKLEIKQEEEKIKQLKLKIRELKTIKFNEQEKEEIKQLKLKIKELKANNFNEQNEEIEELKLKIIELKNIKFNKQNEEIEELKLKITNLKANNFNEKQNELILIIKRKMQVLKDEIKEIKEKGFQNFISKSYKTIKSSYNLKTKRISWDLLNPAVKDLSDLEDNKISLELEIKNRKKDLKEVSKENSENEFNKINEELNSLQEKKKNLKVLENDLNLKWEKIIQDLNSQKEKLNSEKETNFKLATEELKLVLNKKRELSKDEFQILKFETLMKLGEKYGCR